MDELLDLALEQPVGRDPGPLRDDGGDVVLVDLLLDHRRGRGRPALGQLALELREEPVADLGDARELAVALRALRLHAQLVDLAGDLLDAVEDVLLVRPAGRELVPARLRLGELLLERLARRGRLLRHRSELDLELVTRRSASSSSTGDESISIRRRDADSSTRSIALSGRNRSEM